MRYLLIILLGCLPVLAAAVDFDDATRRLPLGKIMQVYEDRTANATIAEVSSAEFAIPVLDGQQPRALVPLRDRVCP